MEIKPSTDLSMMNSALSTVFTFIFKQRRKFTRRHWIYPKWTRLNSVTFGLLVLLVLSVLFCLSQLQGSKFLEALFEPRHRLRHAMGVNRESPGVLAVPPPPSPLDLEGIERTIPRRRDTRVDCAAIIDGDVTETLRAEDLSSGLGESKSRLDASYYKNAASEDCDTFLSTRGYIMSPLSKEEADFPIAFSIIVFTDVEMAERLLRAIYRPQNYYCVHVDARSSQVFEAFKAIASCLPNVVMAFRRVAPVWGTFAVLEADLICMDTLWGFLPWRYFINLTGQEFPLKTNADLVRILKALNGSNDVHSTLKETYVDNGRFHDAPPPSWFRPIKGSVHVTLSRAFVDYVLHDPLAAEILDWLKLGRVSFSDEVFFSTINHNPQLGAPGSYSGHPEWSPAMKPTLSRYKVWNTTDDYFCNSNRFVRHVCILSLGDLPVMLRSVQLFANKFYLDKDRLAISCLEEHLYNTTVQRYLGVGHLDTTFYASLDAVKHQIQPATKQS